MEKNKIHLVNPFNYKKLFKFDLGLTDFGGFWIPIVNEIPRFSGMNYTDNFGFQWNQFGKTQIDSKTNKLSEKRLLAQLDLLKLQLDGNSNILEVGSGAGRFTRVILENSDATLYSIDYSNAVDTNLNNNIDYIERLNLVQASIYELPFEQNSFDLVFCIGVLQHTPDFSKSIDCLVDKVKKGGKIVVDFYPINGFWTFFHAKYILRPITKRMKHDYLLKIIENNIDWLIIFLDILQKLKIGILNRFLPVANLKLFPKSLNKNERREWAILDTFDMFSPVFDKPQRLKNVIKMFQKSGCTIDFAGFVDYEGGSSIVIRATKNIAST
jgi:SAM-dependent methyltransferase